LQRFFPKYQINSGQLFFYAGRQLIGIEFLHGLQPAELTDNAGDRLRAQLGQHQIQFF
jgi:hypothetical protein